MTHGTRDLENIGRRKKLLIESLHLTQLFRAKYKEIYLKFTRLIK